VTVFYFLWYRNWICECYLNEPDASVDYAYNLILFRESDNSVGIVTGCCLDGLGSIPSSARFFSSPQHPDQLWGPLSLLSNGTHLHLVPRSTKVELYLYSPICLHGRAKFTFTLLILFHSDLSIIVIAVIIILLNCSFLSLWAHNQLHMACHAQKYKC
jgi:hypothetical protein